VNTTDEFILAQLAEANPVAETAVPSAQERAEAERLMRRVLDDAPPAPRGRAPRLGILAPVVSIVVVLIVAAVVLRTGGSSTTGASATGGLRIALVAQPTYQTPRITPAVMSRELYFVRQRLRSVRHDLTVGRAGQTGVIVTGPRVPAAERGRIVRLITQPAQVSFYDWEANVLAPNGHTVAQQLARQDLGALRISQGASRGAGQPGTGGMPLYDAVRLAAMQPTRAAGGATARRGAAYYMFGAPGSRACAAAAAALHTAPVPGVHCLLAGPVDGPAGPEQALNQLVAQLPAGVSPASGVVRVVPQGTHVVEAEPSAATGPLSFLAPAARFFVVRDRPALSGADIVNPSSTTDPAGGPAVTFGFTATGRRAFQRTTAQIARRGASVSHAGESLDQHFAVVLDDQLLTVPSISYQQYPDGIIGANGADITGGLTKQSARDLATQLRYGPLPLALRVIS
jgi:SecD/SecF fusion protein